MATGNHKLAVLIDADNAQASVIQELLAEVSRYGTATIKRAYGDWTTTNLKGWKDVLHTMAIQPVQQFSYTTGKNSTDASLIIDAMDVLHDRRVDGFCLVSSDSDFTRLATRIREAGLVVYGFGERKTPVPFVAACDKFVFTEILRPKPAQDKDVQAPEGPALPPLRPMVVNWPSVWSSLLYRPGIVECQALQQWLQVVFGPDCRPLEHRTWLVGSWPSAVGHRPT